MQVDILRELIRQPSVFESEAGATAIVARELHRLGLSPQRVEFAASKLARMPDAQPPFSEVAGRSNLVAIRKGRGGGRSLILNCHLDIVPAGDDEWRCEPFAGEVFDGAIYGRGSYDDKAGAAIILGVLENIQSTKLAGDVIVHFALEDEKTGNGSLLCLSEGPGADAAIIVDGTRGDRGINEHAGNVKFCLSVRGKPASVSVSHMGINAAELLAAAMLSIRSAIFDLNASLQAPWTQFPSPNQMACVALKCDEKDLTVPDFASATLYATMTPPLTASGLVELARDAAGKAIRLHSADASFEIDVQFAAEPVRSRSDEIEAAIAAAVGKPVPFGPSTGTSDLRHFVKRGIPCVLFGPGRGYNPHRANEHFELASLGEMTEALTKVALGWCR